MSPVTKIAVRRLKADKIKHGILAASVLFSMVLISFFLAFEMQVLLYPNPEYEALPFEEFMAKVSMYMNLSIIVLVLITLMMIRIHCRMRMEETAQLRGILTSVGAENKDLRKIVNADIRILYLPAVLLGAMLGILPGAQIGLKFTGMNEEQNLEWLPLTLLFGAAALIGIFLILLCNYMPELRLKRKSVIQAVKKQNNNASEETHGYRQSKTFRSQSLTKRLAQKSIDYHGKVYSRIMLLFASSAVYPLLAVLLLWNISRESVVVDANPYDGIDTIAPVLEIVGGLLWFLIGCFAVLTCVGFVQAMLIARIQIAERRRSANVYRMIGMLPEDINRMIHKEIYGVAVRTLVLLIFVVVILNACFAMIGG